MATMSKESLAELVPVTMTREQAAQVYGLVQAAQADPAMGPTALIALGKIDELLDRVWEAAGFDPQQAAQGSAPAGSRRSGG
jgi:hypothetical protein